MAVCFYVFIRFLSSFLVSEILMISQFIFSNDFSNSYIISFVASPLQLKCNTCNLWKYLFILLVLFLMGIWQLAFPADTALHIVEHLEFDTSCCLHYVRVLLSTLLTSVRLNLNLSSDTCLY